MLALFVLAILPYAFVGEGVASIPDGWAQIVYESYYGAEGAYHDNHSGAWVEFYLGPFPLMAAATDITRRVPFGSGSFWSRGWLRYDTLGRDARQADLDQLQLGSSVENLYRVMGLPFRGKPLPTGGFALEHLVRMGGLRGSHRLWLEFSQNQHLVKK